MVHIETRKLPLEVVMTVPSFLNTGFGILPFFATFIHNLDFFINCNRIRFSAN